MFKQGSLREHVMQVSATALTTGALQPIATTVEIVEDAGLPFILRRVAEQSGKAPAREPSDRLSNPFLPYDPQLFVSDLSTTHLALLNKYSVMDLHLLIVTRQFESQQAPLNEADFSALGRCLAEYPSLGFYNSGRVAGASQAHKHLQLVPLPLADMKCGFPLEPWITSVARTGRLTNVSQLGCLHTLGYWDDSLGTSDPLWSARAYDTYREMLRSLGFLTTLSLPAFVAAPYNLLVTSDWMLAVPRSMERFQGISLNALAFAGAILVQNEAQRAEIRQHGPLAALRRVAVNFD